MNAFYWFKNFKVRDHTATSIMVFEQFLVVLDHWPVFWYRHPGRHLDIEAENLVEIGVEC